MALEEAMKWHPHPFRSDVVTFTWKDLVKLALGKVVQDGALIARRGKDDEVPEEISRTRQGH